MRIRAFISAAAMIGVLGFVAAPAATPAAATLTAAQQTVTWGGHFSGRHLITMVPGLVCKEGACDAFALHIAFGPGYWAAHPGGVEVAIRWPYDGITDLDLVVRDPAGKVIAHSSGLDSNAESVLLAHPADGTYQVGVIPTNTVNPDTFGHGVNYEGLAQFEPAPATNPVHDLLPNLVVFPPDGFHVASALNLIPFPENPVLPCYAEETIQNKSHPIKCLRFNQTIANIGEGRLELRFDMRGIATPDRSDDRMIQRIFRSDGTYFERFAARYKFHAVHAHIHYQGFGRSFLYKYDWANGRIGAAVRAGNKVGFCVTDVKLLDAYWGATGNGQRLSQTFPGCNIPKEIHPLGPVWMVQGIDVGWADVYGWNLADQYIDITGVPNGLYQLEQVANPTDSVLESSTADNTAATVICIAGNTVTAVTSAGQAAACVA
jgi:hypothetical protein